MSSSTLADSIRAAAAAVLQSAEQPAPADQRGPIALYIDHTLLKPEATPAQVARLCDEARQFRFASVCVNPSYVPLCVEALVGSEVAVCTVAGFPLGATTTAAKAAEAAEVIAAGAREVDMVIAIGRLVADDYEYVLRDIAAVIDTCHSGGALCKVIIETALLTDEQKVVACLLAVRAGADFVKTSTGFSSGGATVADIGLMRRAVGPTIGVKASGGVRDLAAARALIAAGATRIGASAGVAIVRAEEGDMPQGRENTDSY